GTVPPGGDVSAEPLDDSALLDFVRRAEREHPRWAGRSTRSWYPRFLAAGVRVERCVDLALCGAILRRANATAGSGLHGASPAWLEHVAEAADDALCLLGTASEGDVDELDELTAQLNVVSTVADRRTAARLRLLLAAESAGSLVA